MTKQVKCVVGVSQINITKDKIYDVIDENYVCYKITNDLGKTDYFNKSLFEKYKSTKFVKLVNNYSNCPDVTINKIYEVVEEHHYTYSIVNDKGIELLYSKNMFVKSIDPGIDTKINIKEGKIIDVVDLIDEENENPKYKFIPKSEILEVNVNGIDGILIKE